MTTRAHTRPSFNIKRLAMAWLLLAASVWMLVAPWPPL